MTRKNKSFVGRHFGMLTVMSFSHLGKSKHKYWHCVCSCGKTSIVCQSNLTSGHTKSCGCLHKEAVSSHGKSRVSAYSAWLGMLDRCENPDCKNYRDYGARGIKVCDRWHDIASFLADMGDRPTSRHSLDRIDVNGNYEPGNCRWATVKEKHSTLLNRLRHGWDVEKALTTPARSYKRSVGGCR